MKTTFWHAAGVAALLVLAGCPDKREGDGSLAPWDTHQPETVSPDGAAQPDVPSPDPGPYARSDGETPGPAADGLVTKDEAEPACGKTGTPCTSNLDCCSEYCVEAFDEDFVCTDTCIDQCPEGWSCKVVLNSYPDVVTICVPNNSKLCKPCKNDLQCNGGQCIPIDDAHFCTVDCSKDSCPDGFECLEDQAGAKRCIPSNGTCDCGPGTHGDVRPCVKKNAMGACQGTETCNAEAGWETCNAPEPADEVCDGKDNDCNGLLDELSTDPLPCEQKNEHGKCTGLATCQGLNGWVCMADEPAEEKCDFLDNDCDGATDEAFKNAAGKYADIHHCGGCNKDCEGLFENGTAKCDETKPVPQCVVGECAPGYYAANQYQCLPEIDTVCQPCTVDFQCGGGVCAMVGGGQFCLMPCGGGEECALGFVCLAAMDAKDAPKGMACAPLSQACDCTPIHDGAKKPCTSQNDKGTCYGFQKCDGAFGWGECDAPMPAEEVCDGLDNDCNGDVDDALPAAVPCENDWPGVGTCEGEATCQGGAGWVCKAAQPSVEACDYADNDCDGQIDEVYKNANGKYATLEHCGACGTNCAIPNAVSKCDDGKPTPLCVVAQCAPGFYKLNDYLCLPEGDSQCKLCASDAQCDGMQCVEIGEGTFCLQECTPGGGECDAGSTCKAAFDPDAGGEGTFCVPLNGTCDCSATTKGAKKPCEKSNEVGTCVGFQVCDPATGWSPCSASFAAEEVCDGIDNDCDGLVDVGFPQTKPCQKQSPAGTCQGTSTCFGAKGWICDAAEPSAEACDFKDNDCDGAVDEDFKNEGGKYGSHEHCGTCNSPCGGTIQGAATEKCDGSKAKPQCVVDKCKEGLFQLNEYQCIEKPNVTCVKCASDADCYGGACVSLPDGKACLDSCKGGTACKAGFVCDGAHCQPKSGSCDCTEATKGVKMFCAVESQYGTCVGFKVCDPQKGWSACDAGNPGPEVCDGLDNDCNGIPDDGLPATQPCSKENEFGKCTGVETCQGSLGWACQAPAPAQDVCDYKDNDCNGVVDQAFTDAAGKYVTNAHCGACGKACGNVIANSAEEKCDVSKPAPQCVATSCKPGYFFKNELQCIPNPAIACSPCVADDTCYGGKCVKVGPANFCLEPCEAGSCTKAGYVCGAGGLCEPKNGSCDCSQATAGAKRTCQVTNKLGTCLGFETCQPTVGWTGCTAATPAAEVCDGIDSDCNGQIDDGLPPSQQCFNKNTFGVCKGQAVCYGASGWVCLAPEPAAESCDFKDNDCDGLTDEDYKDASGKYATMQHCGTCKNACGAAIEHSKTEMCDTQKTIPQCVVVECDEGYIKLNDFQCLEVPDVECDPCSSDANCFGSKCHTVDQGSFCLLACGAGGECSPGYECVSGTCWPMNGSCDCNEETAGSKRTCLQTSALGICYGFETCAPALGWGQCDAPAPVKEVCNGKDDDCNGFIDDGLPDVLPCQKTNAFGTCPGQQVCFGTVGWFCQAPVPQKEICDFKDNDCDGFTDEDFKNDAGKYGSDAHCGGCNSSCAGAIINGTATCDASKDVPACVVKSCGVGWEKYNEYLCVPITATLCESCATDDNCITAGARCFQLEDGMKCGTACTVNDDCPDAYACMDPGIGEKQCVPVTGSCECDGSNLDLQKACTKEYVPPGGGPTQTCFGTNYCTETGWSGCTLPAEVCNNLDDNCDGNVDESFKSSKGEYASDQHCGKCNLNCAEMNFVNAVGKCDTKLLPPDCKMVCKDGFFDTNQNPGDGCECEYLSATDYPDGDDQNCDGIDGEIAKGVFVSKSGSDDNPGTRELPKLTIQAGVDTAKSQGKRDVYVMTSVYSENVLLVPGVGVYGGYGTYFSDRDVDLYETAVIGAPPTQAKPGAVNAVDVKGAGEATVFDGFLVFGFDNKEPGQSSYAIYARGCDKRLRITNNRILGGSGGNGSPGAHGLDGGNGASGTSGTNTVDTTSCTPGNKVTSGGTAGTNACGTTATDGGKGGDGYCPNYETTAQLPQEAGAAGKNGGGTGGGHGFDGIIAPAGGTPGDLFGCNGVCGYGSASGCWCDSFCASMSPPDCCADACQYCGQGCWGPGLPTGVVGCFIGNGCNSCIIPPGNLPMAGADGLNGKPGIHGPAGTACVTPSGSISGGQWVAGVGKPGTDGSHGAGGGGGGAGNGVQTCACPIRGGPDVGGTGGGGGAGGCGGTTGQGGTGGGGSFGIFLLYDAAPASAPIIADNSIQRGSGGLGGPGGNGGVGGLGAVGGSGGAAGTGSSTTFCAGKGGNGGKGGDGGHASGGGGGCGGASYAVFAHGKGTVPFDAIKAGVALLPGGKGGTGGPGGLSLGQSGKKGDNGAFDVTNF